MIAWVLLYFSLGWIWFAYCYRQAQDEGLWDWAPFIVCGWPVWVLWTVAIFTICKLTKR